ncbi:hypothetical protein SAMN05421837_107376 [Amycolatopsis pretoriensis]|uniref:Transglycosylase SLT domain-containing protein n=1 Tax=Amycolatopsis pretoriensis TaxID=218821 RepID=A0A1H5R7W7_9PSEU|nr:transglycosylase SLT domain-containing protein [Amycolatopsis pretoriensis]SEF34409.1 hypothetical protein SAMN05421837_107376 [Amycolatopsis pretoriensis]
MATLQYNIIALDQFTATFERAAAEIERISGRLERLNGQSARVAVDVKTDDSQKALDSFTTRFQLMAAGIIAASPAVGAAILGGAGAGFIGLAALAVQSNDQVKQTYQNLWSNVVNETKAGAAQLAPQIVAAGNQMGAAADRLGPQLRQAFSAAGPDITALSRGVTTFATNAMPGAVSATQASLPIFEAAANVMGVLGTSFSTNVQSIGQHSSDYARFVTSIGNVTSSVLGVIVSVVNDIASAWAGNADEIDAAIAGVADVITGLAQGVLPVFAAALGAAASAVREITAVLGPMAPVLGTLAALALAAWAAFKGASLVTAGVKALSSTVLDVGTAMEKAATRSAATVAAMQGVSVGSSAAAGAITTAGAAASSGALRFGVMASELAGPVGIALIAGVGLFALLKSQVDSTSGATDALKGNLDGVTSALESTDGAISNSVIKALQNEQGFKDAAAATDAFAIKQSDLATAVTQGGVKLDSLKAKLQAIIDAHKQYATDEVTGELNFTGYDDEGAAAAKALDAVNLLTKGFKGSQDAAAENQRAIEQHASAMTSTPEGFAAAGSAAMLFGGSLGTVRAGLDNVAKSSGDASISLDDVVQKYEQGALAIANATASIQQGFAQADKAVAQAQNAVSDAAHSASNASRAIGDARHSEAQAAQAVVQAEQAVADAQRGVMTAQQNYVKAQDQERQAQRALSEARQQAVKDLKALHDQLEDAFTSEAQARVRLFDAQQAAAGFGITGGNAKGIASQTVTAENEDKVKAAIDLLSAQNALNQAQSNNVDLRDKVAKADAAGVNGAQNVVAAQQAVVAAQQQVSDSAYGVDQAKRSLTRAQQGVADAAYGEQRAHQAVRDAQYQASRAADQLRQAKEALTEAEKAASRSLDVSTEAGRRNLGELFNLANAIKTEFGPTSAGYNTLIQKTADAFGITTDKAADLLKGLHQIPQDWRFDVTAVANVDTASLQQVFKGTDAGGYYNDSKNVKKTIGGTGYAEGGHIRGPGGPTGDAIPAWLSDNEYIQPADVVDYYGIGFMDDVRRKRLPRFARGGAVRWNAFGAGAGAAYISTVDALTAMGLPHPAQLPQWTPPVVPIPTFGGVPGNRAGNVEIVRQVFASMFGWTGAEWDAAVALIMSESGFNNTIKNPTSTAYGIFQFLDSTWGGYGIPKTSDPTLQAIAGGRYIRARYTDPINAWAFKRSHNWYSQGGPVHDVGTMLYGRPKVLDTGGTVDPGLNLIYNGTGRGETVRTGATEDKLLAAVTQIAAAQSTTGTFVGALYLESGEFLGKVRGEVAQEFRRMELASGVL